MIIKLDKINKTILFELDKNCRISDNQLAKKVKRSREAVRNRINKLVEQGVIQGFVAQINPSRFGYMMFKMYFQLRNQPKERERFSNYFMQVPGLYWCGENEGIWDFHAAIYSKNLEEFNKLKNKLYTEFKNLIIKRDIGVLIDVRHYSKRFHLDKTPESNPSRYAGKIINNEIDELDKKILKILAHNARIPFVELANKINSTIDIIRNRMKKLESKEIITRYRIAIDYRKIGYEYFKAFIYFDNLSEQAEKKLIQFSNQHKEIYFLIRQLSAWDIELEIMAKNYEHFTQIMNKIRQEFSDVIRNYEFALMRTDIWFLGERDII